jgi:hypothetical protein
MWKVPVVGGESAPWTVRLTGALLDVRSCDGGILVVSNGMLHLIAREARVPTVGRWVDGCVRAGNFALLNFDTLGQARQQFDTVMWACTATHCACGGCSIYDACAASCSCTIRARAGVHALILPPWHLDDEEAEIYVALRRDGMSPVDAEQAAQLL